MTKKESFSRINKKTRIWFRIHFYHILQNRLVKFLSVVIFFVFIAAIFVTLLEGASNPQFSNLGQGLWWAVVTMTTVGYGDMVPGSVTGRIIASVVMFSGIALLSTFTAALSSMVITRKLKENKGLTKIKAKNHIAILGWNPFLEDVILDILEEAIREGRSIVLINKKNPDDVEEIKIKFKEIQIKFVYGDFTDESVLVRANIAAAKAVIILPDESDPGRAKSDETTILACLTVKSIEQKVKVVAHLLERSNQAHLRRANADQIVVSNRYSGFFLANHVVAPGIPEAIDILLDCRQGMRIARHKLPGSMIDKPFAEISSYYKKENDAILIGFIKEEQSFKLEDILTDDYSAIDTFIKNKLENAGKGLLKKSKIDVNLNPPKDYRASEKEYAILIEKS